VEAQATKPYKFSGPDKAAAGNQNINAPVINVNIGQPEQRPTQQPVSLPKPVFQRHCPTLGTSVLKQFRYSQICVVDWLRAIQGTTHGDSIRK